MKQLHLQAVKSKLFTQFWIVNDKHENTFSLLGIKEDPESDIFTFFKN